MEERRNGDETTLRRQGSMESVRRRSSASLNDTTTQDELDIHEEHGLLGHRSKSSLKNGSDSIGRKPRLKESGRDSSRWLRPAGFIFTIIILVTIALTSATTLFLQPALSSKISFFGFEGTGPDRMLGIELHPEHHVFRSSKSITHYWKITSGFRFADGVRKRVYLVNGEFPGPTIECRIGDRLIIHVTNELESEGVSIHWHGLNMKGANSMDGAAGFTQCPIPVGGDFKYEFVVDETQPGTFWWHAHLQVQRGDGLYGGLVVHESIHTENERESYDDTKEVLLLIGDWYHRSAEEVLMWYMSVRGFGNEPVPDSLLVNGAGRFICSMVVPARPVECVDNLIEQVPKLLSHRYRRQPTRLRIVNVGSLAGFTLGVKSGTLQPLTIDGGFPIAGNVSDSIGILYPGERVDLLLEWSKDANLNDAQLYVSLDPENFKYPNQALRQNQTFPLLSNNSRNLSRESIPSGTNTHFDLSKSVAAPSISSSNILRYQFPKEEQVNQTILLYTKTQKLAINSNHPTGFINRTSWSPQSSPLGPLIALPRSSWDSNQLVPYIPLPSSGPIWVDIIINNLDDGSHPFHLHGHSFYVLASSRSEHGWGSYSPYATTGASAVKPVLNLERPVKKDTISVPRRGYVVIRFRADNEGIWMLHCHVLFHQASGMAMGIQVGGGEETWGIDEGARSLCSPAGVV